MTAEMNRIPERAREALVWAQAELARKVASPEVDAELLLGHVLGCSRADLYSDPARPLSEEERARLQELVYRRAGAEPLQYLTGSQAFRYLQLEVGPGVLVPRPETEVLVERALDHLAGVERPAIADVGTGSGAIALSIATERPDARVWATEISDRAIHWAQRNLDRTGLRNVTILGGDLFEPLPGELRGGLDLIAANPPYLSEADLASAPPDVREHEPVVATTSGPSGLEVTERIIAGALSWLRPGGWLVVETWPGQAERVRRIMGARYSEVDVSVDLAGALRVAEGRKPVGPGR